MSDTFGNATVQLEEISGVVWTDDDGTQYKRVWGDDGPEDIEVL